MCNSKGEGGLGFRELAKFNEAILTKQVWRLVHYTKSLFYKVFKAKYFLQSSIFEAKASSRSYVWKSTVKARKFIVNGAKWRIDNGCSTQIYKDNWLPGDGEGKVTSPMSILVENSTITKLIDVDTGSWNLALIYILFCTTEAKKKKKK